MPSLLETVPHDVLQHIAFLLGTLSVMEPPQHLLSLLLASSKIHRSLNVHNCPHLYANIFRATFDVDFRLHPRLTDSALAVELCQRYRVLRRARRQDMSTGLSSSELWVVLRMILEDKGRNQRHQAAAGFLGFILSFMRTRIEIRDADPQFDQEQISALAMWLLCLTLSHSGLLLPV